VGGVEAQQKKKKKKGREEISQPTTVCREEEKENNTLSWQVVEERKLCKHTASSKRKGETKQRHTVIRHLLQGWITLVKDDGKRECGNECSTLKSVRPGGGEERVSGAKPSGEPKVRPVEYEIHRKL